MAVVSTLVVRVMASVADFEKEIGSLEKSWQRTGRQLQSVGSELTKAITLPIVAVGTAGAVAFANFEREMNRVAAVSGATGTEFEALERQAMSLGATTQYSAREAAQAMGFLAMAGLSASDILGAMPSTLQLAASAQLDLANAADITTNVMTGYGMQVGQLEHVNDVLVTAFTSANTNLSQLGEAFKYAGPLANAAGLSFEETAAALAIMGNAGFQGSMAGTALRGAITRILNPTGEVAAAMRAAGLSFTDANGRMLPLAQIIQQLEPHADNAGLMMQLFGQRAGPAMAALVLQGSDAVAALTAKMENNEGIAGRIAETMMQGLMGAWIQFRSASEGLAISIGKVLAPSLEVVAGLLTQLAQFAQNVLVPAFTALPVPVQMFVIGLVGLAAAAGPALWIMGQLYLSAGALAGGMRLLTAEKGLLRATILTSVIPSLTTMTQALWALRNPLNQAILYAGLKAKALQAIGMAGNGLAAMLAGFAGAIRLVAVAMVSASTWAAIFTGIKIAVLALTGPIGLLVLGVTALGVIAWNLVGGWDGVKAAFSAVASIVVRVTGFFQDLWTVTTELARVLWGSFKQVLSDIAGWFGRVADAATSLVRPSAEFREEMIALTSKSNFDPRTLEGFGNQADQTANSISRMADAIRTLNDEVAKMNADIRAVGGRSGGETGMLAGVFEELDRVAAQVKKDQEAVLGKGAAGLALWEQHKTGLLPVPHKKPPPAPIDPELQRLMDQLTGANTRAEVAKLQSAFLALTPAQRSNADVVARVIKEYEKLRQVVGGGVAPALERLYIEHARVASKPGLTQDQMWHAMMWTPPTDQMERWRGLTPSGTLKVDKERTAELRAAGNSFAMGSALFGIDTSEMDKGKTAKDYDASRPPLFAGFSQFVQDNLGHTVMRALTGGGNVARSVGGLMGGFVTESIAKPVTAALSGALGATIGGALGSVLPGLGNILGSIGGQLIGRLFNWGGPSQQELEGRAVAGDFRAQLEGTLTAQQRAEAGGQRWAMSLIAVRDTYLATGRTAEQAHAVMDRLWRAEKMGAEAVKKVMDEIGMAFNERAADVARLEDAMKRYGFTVEQMGAAFRNEQAAKQAKELIEDWRVLQQLGGVDLVTVNERMAASFNDFLHAGLRVGTEIPSAMRPILESLAQQGLLLDLNGAAVSDLGSLGIVWSETMSEGFDRVVLKLQQLIEVLQGGGAQISDIAGATLAAAESMQYNPAQHYTAREAFDAQVAAGQVANTPIAYMRFLRDYVPSYANEGVVRKPTLAMVGDASEPEYILHESTVRRLAEGGGSGPTVHITINGTIIGNSDEFRDAVTTAVSDGLEKGGARLSKFRRVLHAGAVA